jgi:hypothetical protein
LVFLVGPGNNFLPGTLFLTPIDPSFDCNITVYAAFINMEREAYVQRFEGRFVERLKFPGGMRGEFNLILIQNV